MKTPLAFAAVAALVTVASAPIAAAQDDEMPPAAWLFSQDEGTTFFQYGWPGEWETQGNSLSCDDHSGKVEIGYWVDHQINPNDVGGKEKTRLMLRSGSIQKTLDAEAQDEEMNGGVEISATLSADDPLLAEFARTGALEMTAYGAKTDMPNAKPADASKLLRACRK